MFSFICVGCQCDTARICCWAPAANPRWNKDGRTDGRTLDRFIDSAPHAIRACVKNAPKFTKKKNTNRETNTRTLHTSKLEFSSIHVLRKRAVTHQAILCQKSTLLFWPCAFQGTRQGTMTTQKFAAICLLLATGPKFLEEINLSRERRDQLEPMCCFCDFGDVL